MIAAIRRALAWLREQLREAIHPTPIDLTKCINCERRLSSEQIEQGDRMCADCYATWIHK